MNGHHFPYKPDKFHLNPSLTLPFSSCFDSRVSFQLIFTPKVKAAPHPHMYILHITLLYFQPPFLLPAFHNQFSSHFLLKFFLTTEQGLYGHNYSSCNWHMPYWNSPKSKQGPTPRVRGSSSSGHHPQILSTRVFLSPSFSPQQKID